MPDMAEDELVRWGYRLLAGEMPPPEMMTHAFFREATAAAHRDAQWRDVPLREAIAVAALVEDFIRTVR